MEQITNGILKLMNFPTGSHVNMTRDEFGTKREEPTFDALLEQKSGEARSEVVNNRRKPKESDEKDPATEEVRTQKNPEAEKDQEESCDVAREAASAQIVWLVGQNNQDLLVQRQEDVAVIEEPMLIVTNDTPAAQLSELVIPQPAAETETLAEIPEEGMIPAAEGELIPEQTVEIVQKAAEPQIETGFDGREAEKADVEIRVTGEEEAEETSGETAVEAPLFKDVEATPIKVAEAPERTGESAPVERQVAEKLTNLLDSGETRVEIQLEPLELGKLTISLTRNEDGVLNILLSAESVQTRDLLERHMGSLQEALFERGQQSVQITVDRNEESQRQDGQQRNDFQDGSNDRRNEQQRRDDRPSGEDFLQQLRLGLIPIEDEEED